ncbi:MAG: phage tail protein [Akkermansiaceae bacterium]
MEGMIAEIRMFGGNFAPRSWALCEGQLMPISQNQALFSLLGTTYGGDGRTTFALPDFRGRVPVQHGTGAGLSTYQLGQKGGTEEVVLNANQIPSHTHAAALKVGVSTNQADTDDPSGSVFGVGSDDAFREGAANATMDASSVSGTIGNTGGNQSHTNVQPYLAINFIICLFGVFPPRS